MSPNQDRWPPQDESSDTDIDQSLRSFEAAAQSLIDRIGNGDTIPVAEVNGLYTELPPDDSLNSAQKEAFQEVVDAIKEALPSGKFSMSDGETYTYNELVKSRSAEDVPKDNIDNPKQEGKKGKPKRNRKKGPKPQTPPVDPTPTDADNAASNPIDQAVNNIDLNQVDIPQVADMERDINSFVRSNRPVPYGLVDDAWKILKDDTDPNHTGQKNRFEQTMSAANTRIIQGSNGRIITWSDYLLKDSPKVVAIKKVIGDTREMIVQKRAISIGEIQELHKALGSDSPLSDILKNQFGDELKNLAHSKGIVIRSKNEKEWSVDANIVVSEMALNKFIDENFLPEKDYTKLDWDETLKEINTFITNKQPVPITLVQSSLKKAHGDTSTGGVNINEKIKLLTDAFARHGFFYEDNGRISKTLPDLGIEGLDKIEPEETIKELTNGSSLVVVDSVFNKLLQKDSIGENETPEQQQKRLAEELGQLLPELAVLISKLNESERAEIGRLLVNLNTVHATKQEQTSVDELPNLIESLRTKINDPKFANDLPQDARDSILHILQRIKTIIYLPLHQKMGIDSIFKGESAAAKQFVQNRSDHKKENEELTKEIASLHLDLENPKGPEPIAFKIATLKQIHSKIKSLVWKEGGILLKEIAQLREFLVKKQKELEEKESLLKEARARLHELTLGASSIDNSGQIIALSKSIGDLESKINGIENVIGAAEYEIKNRLGILNNIKSRAKHIQEQEIKLQDSNDFDELSKHVESAMGEYKEIKHLVEHKDDSHDGHGHHGHGHDNEHGHHHGHGDTLASKMKGWGLVGGGLVTGLFVIFVENLWDTIRDVKGGGGSHGGGDHGKKHGGGGHH